MQYQHGNTHRTPAELVRIMWCKIENYTQFLFSPPRCSVHIICWVINCFKNELNSTESTMHSYMRVQQLLCSKLKISHMGVSWKCAINFIHESFVGAATHFRDLLYVICSLSLNPCEFLRGFLSLSHSRRVVSLIVCQHRRRRRLLFVLRTFSIHSNCFSILKLLKQSGRDRKNWEHHKIVKFYGYDTEKFSSVSSRQSTNMKWEWELRGENF